MALAMNLVASFLLYSLAAVALLQPYHSADAAPTAAPTVSGSGEELTVRIFSAATLRYFKVDADGTLSPEGLQDNPNTHFIKTTVTGGTVRLQSAANPAHYLLLVEEDSTWSYSVGVPSSSGEGSGVGVSTVHSEWEVVEYDQDHHSLRVVNSNGDHCYLAANFNGSLVSDPCAVPTQHISAILRIKSVNIGVSPQ